jgi:hypothetical protein
MHKWSVGRWYIGWKKRTYCKAGRIADCAVTNKKVVYIIVCHCLVLACKRYRTLSCKFLKPKDLENMRMYGLTSLVANIRPGVITEPQCKIASIYNGSMEMYVSLGNIMELPLPPLAPPPPIDFCDQAALMYNLSIQDVSYYLWSETNGKNGKTKFVCIFCDFETCEISVPHIQQLEWSAKKIM